MPSSQEGTDLIYEGITTELFRWCGLLDYLIFKKELTWFTKGLRQECANNLAVEYQLKELTWFTKGLRPALPLPSYTRSVLCRRNWPDLRRDYDWKQIPNHYQNIHQHRRNWPDLRRDYDSTVKTFSLSTEIREGTDLIYEGITTGAAHLCCFRQFFTMKELTWFTKGLRQTAKNRSLARICVKELTWFTKGLRRIKCKPTLDSWHKEGTDLIYEGITTSAHTMQTPTS
jgi:hypothetical protein